MHKEALHSSLSSHLSGVLLFPALYLFHLPTLSLSALKTVEYKGWMSVRMTEPKYNIHCGVGEWNLFHHRQIVLINLDQ